MSTACEQISFINEAQTQDTRGYTLRLRERQQADKDLITFSDTEILQLLVSYTGGEKAARLAEVLLETFGSLKGVLEARPEQQQGQRHRVPDSLADRHDSPHGQNLEPTLPAEPGPYRQR